MAARIYSIPCRFIIMLLFLLASTDYAYEGDLGRAAKIDSYMNVSANRCNISLPRSGKYAVAIGPFFDYGNACGQMIEVTCIAAIGESGNCLPGNDIVLSLMIIGWTDKVSDKTLTLLLSKDAYYEIAGPNATSININFRIVSGFPHTTSGN